MEMFDGTPHNSAKYGDFAKTVLMPGDPQRAEYIAKTFLSNARLVNNVRGAQGYTGFYKDMLISVMASGMGMPSIGIYSYELYKHYGVENIIRVGSAGAITEKVHLRDLIIGQAACTDSNYIAQFNLPGYFTPIADYQLMKVICQAAKKLEKRHLVGSILSTDRFYNNDIASVEEWGKLGVLAVEMESAALYTNAALFGKKAVTICTISDHLLTGEKTSREERRSSFNDMIIIALEAALKLEKGGKCI